MILRENNRDWLTGSYIMKIKFSSTNIPNRFNQKIPFYVCFYKKMVIKSNLLANYLILLANKMSLQLCLLIKIQS